MPATFVKGDIFADDELASSGAGLCAFACGADTSGAMDKGVAVAFAKRWPELAEAYRLHAEAKKVQLGDVFVWRGASAESRTVVYVLAIHQAEKKPKVSTVTRALDAMLARAAEDGVARILLTPIGAGKGGIDRDRLKRVLVEAGAKTPIGIVVFEQFVRARSTPG